MRLRLDNLRARPLVEDVIAAAAEHFGTTPAALVRHTRRQPVTTWRMVAMAAAREATGMSYAQIGEAFSRHHTTVFNAVRMVQAEDEASSVAADIARSCFLKNTACSPSAAQVQSGKMA